VIWRDSTDLPEELIFRVNYLGGDMPTFALNFSRPGGQIACQYFNFVRLGREGYRKIQQACLDSAAYFADRVVKLGPFEIVYDGRGGLPAACWKLRDGADPGYNLYDLADRLRWHGWQVPAYALPTRCEDWVVQRILVRLGVSRDLLKMLLADFRSAIEHLEKHAPREGLAEEKSSGFKH
jgi:glutamate decarboxylase